MVIFLIGYMGCGKSTIGRMVAARLGAQFIDMDKHIEQQAGMTVAQIFAAHGEAAFRRMETDFLAQPFDPGGITVVATGGGAPCQGDNMALMNRTGRTIYFKMSPRRLIARLGPGRAKRPLIKDMDEKQLLDFIGRSLAVRGPVYERAHLTIDCEGVGDEYIARHIEHYIEQTKNKI